jgi:unsaturated rhamnogalacturonyl hydrolase
MPNNIYGLSRSQIDEAIYKLIGNLVNIRDDSGAFTFQSDGMTTVNDKTWKSWDWT